MEKLCYATDEERDAYYSILRNCDARKKQQTLEAKEKRETQNKLLEEIRNRELAQKHIIFDRDSDELHEKIQKIRSSIDSTKQFIEDNEKMIAPYKQKLHNERVELYNTESDLRKMCYDHKVELVDGIRCCVVCKLDLR